MIRFNSPSPRTKQQLLSSWQPWFAWHPIQIEEQLVWLETIHRQWSGGTYSGRWIYRLIDVK